MTYSELRASDAERERVVAFLREHALLGRLNDDELEERIGLAYASVTVGDLERLIADLPRKNRHPSPRPAHHHHHRPARRQPPKGALIAAGLGALLLTGLPFVVLGLAMAIGFAILATVFALSMLFGPVLLVIVLVMALRRRRPRRPPPMRWGPQY